MSGPELRAERIRSGIQEFKSRFPDSSLEFLEDEEWLAGAQHDPRNLSLPLDLKRVRICDECHSKNGAFLDTEKCPGSMLTLDREKSREEKCIVFSETLCRFLLERRNYSNLRFILIDSGINAKWIYKSKLDNFNPDVHPSAKKALETCKRYCDRFPELSEEGIGLYIFGPPYTGKTHLAVGCAFEIASRYNKAIRYITSSRLINVYRKKISSKGKDVFEEDAFSFVQDELVDFDGLLLLDDLGAENPTDSTVFLLNFLISSRSESNKPTIYTSLYPVNNDKESLSSRYELFGPAGKSITSKILSKSGVIDMRGTPPYPIKIEI